MYTSRKLSITGGSEGRKLEAGKEAEGTEESCLLAYPSGFLSHYLHRDGATHRDLGHQLSIINQDHTPTDLRTGRPNEDILLFLDIFRLVLN